MAKVSTKGYKKNSKDKNETSLRIPSPMITMKEDDGTPLRKGPILGIDNLGNQQMMYPGMDYQFPGNYVDEIPMAKMGGTRKVKIHALGGNIDPEKPIGPGKPSNPYQVVDGKYVFTLPDGTTWSTDQRDKADSINAYFAHGWGFTGDRTANGDPAWARIPKEVTDSKELTIEDAGTSNDPDVQKVIVNTPKGDVTKLQNLKTKKFIGYEASGKPLDIKNATGDPSVDFRRNLKMLAPSKPEDETLAGKDANYREGYYSFANMMGNKSPAPLLPQHYAMYNEGIPYMNPDFKSALLQNRYSLPSGYSNDLQNQGYTFFPESGTWGIDINKQGPGEMGYKKFGGGLPKAQYGLATAADSSLVANRANDVLNYYKNNPAYDVSLPHVYPPGVTPRPKPSPSDLAKSLKRSKEAYNKSVSLQDGRTFFHVDRNGQTKMVNNPKLEDYYQDLGNNKFLQRELSSGALNMDSPMPIYDTRINPQKVSEFDMKPSFARNFPYSMGRGYPTVVMPIRDHVEVATYDILATTPWKELSTEEQLKRLKKFGTSGSPYKNKASAIKELKAKLNEPKIEAPIIDKPVQIPNQPEDIKIPFKADPNRRQFSIKPIGDAALDKLNQELYGNFGSLTNNGYIPEYSSYIKDIEPRTPEKEMRRIKTPKFNYGGDLPKAQNGKNILYVDSKKDPAYKAYSDSLNLYKAMIMQDKLMGSNTTNDPYINARRAGNNKPPLSDFTVKSLKEGRVPRLVPGLEHLGPIARDFNNAAELKDFANFLGSKNDIKLLDYYKSLGFNDNNIMYHTSADVVHPKIKPVDSYWDGSAWSPVYKKPRRQVIVQKVPDKAPMINTPTQLVSQPDDIKIPFKADITRRGYPMQSTGDAAIDAMNLKLFGENGILTGGGYIPLDDPKYHPYNGIMPAELRTPEMRRSYGKFEQGGGLPKAQKGLRKVVYNDPKQFKIANQAYKDSMGLYNLGNQEKEAYMNMLSQYNLDPRYIYNMNSQGIPNSRYHNKIAPILYSEIDDVGGGYTPGSGSYNYYRKNDGSDLQVSTTDPLNNKLQTVYSTYKKPETRPVFEEVPDPEMIDIKPFAMPQIGLKPQLGNIPQLPIPQTNKQRVIINTPQGDKIRVQDPKTKKFMWWEDEKGLPTDIENPTGIPYYDFKFANGGDISVPDLRRVKIHNLPKAQTGIPADYQKFLQYSETAPDNRRPDAEWQYGNPRQYDHYGMWDALGKPKNFDEALTNYPQWQPDEYDGMYHGFSTNPNTGVWLKSHIPGESHPGDTGWMEYKAFMLSNDRNWGGKNQNLVYDPELQRMRYIERKKEGGSLPMAQYGPPDWRNMLDYKNAFPKKQNLVGDVRKVARPTAVAESTKVATQKLPANYKELKEEADLNAAADRRIAENKFIQDYDRVNGLTPKPGDPGYKFIAPPINDPAGLPSVPIFESLLMAPVALGSAGLAGLGEMAYGAAAATPLFQATGAALSASPAALPGLSASNAVNAAFAAHGLKTIVSGEAIEPWRHAAKTGNVSDYLSAAGQNLITGLETLPVTAPLIKGGYELAKPAINAAGEFLTTQTPLKNAYKINPWAIKENPETFLYRAQPKEFDATASTLNTLKKKLASGEGTAAERSLWNQYVKQYEAGHSNLVAQNDFYGKWFEKDPNRLDWYLNSGDKYDAGTQMNILRTKVPTSEAEAFKVANVKSAQPISASMDTEFVLPQEMIQSSEVFPETSLQDLIAQHNSFNTPDWLRGYKGTGTPKKLTVQMPEMPAVGPQATVAPWAAESLPGLHLESTVTGGPISKIVEPKTGLVNTEQALKIIGKESGGKEKLELVKNAIGENIPAKMDYNQFRKLVQDAIIPLERKTVNYNSNYGLGHIGFPSPKKSNIQLALGNSEQEIARLTGELDNVSAQISNIKGFRESVASDPGKAFLANGTDEQIKTYLQGIADYTKEQIALSVRQAENNRKMLSEAPLENETLLLSNKEKLGRGVDAHNNPRETLGHIHYYVDAENPNTAVMTQMQSDAFQGTHRTMPNSLEEATNKLTQAQEDLDWTKGLYFDNDPSSLRVMNKANEEFAFDKATVENYVQKSLLDKKHQERYLQEFVDHAASKGMDKVRIPTSETAAKVQGYNPLEFDPGSAAATDARRKVMEAHKLYGPESKEFVEANANYDALVKNTKPEYIPAQKTILKKYEQMPKTIKKTFGEEVQIVTDGKGNTWYEFSIPKNFMEGKGEIKAFKEGGTTFNSSLKRVKINTLPNNWKSH